MDKRSIHLLLIAFMASGSLALAQETATSLESGCDMIAKQLSEKLQQKAIKLAVLELKDNSLEVEEEDKFTSSLGRLLADETINALSNRLTIQEIYDRKATQRRLKELGLGNSDMFNPAKAKQFGMSIGVDAIIIGSYNIKKVSQSCRVIVKAIEVETGKIIATASADFLTDSEVIERSAITPIGESSPRGVPTYNNDSRSIPSPPKPAQELPKTVHASEGDFIDFTAFDIPLNMIATNEHYPECVSNPCILLEWLGRRNVLVMHPYSPDKSATLQLTSKIPAHGITYLIFSLHSDMRGDASFETYINGFDENRNGFPIFPRQEVNKKTGWLERKISLEQFKGKTITFILYNKANGWHFEFCYVDYFYLLHQP